MTQGRATGLPWGGGGPWAIREECTAHTHNNLRVARSRYGMPKCICPRAVKLVDEENARRRASGVSRQPRKSRGPREPMTTNGARIDGAWVPKGVERPDLSAGLCSKPFGIVIVDKVLDSNGGAGTRAVKEHKDLCSFCPVIAKCEKYILAAEVPAGSWWGVWAGMSQKDRRDRARQEGRP